MTFHSSANDVINTFNQFFTNIPANKSFDMSYKVYIRELADVDDRGGLSARNSSVNLQSVQPTTIASHGIVPTTEASSTSLDLSLRTMPTTKTSSTSLMTSNKSTSSTEAITMSQVDRICADNKARKMRSMVNLYELNKKYGMTESPPAFVASPTIYENLSTLTPDRFSEKSKNISGNNSEIEKLPEIKKNKGEDTIYIKISDCFH